MLIRPPVHVTFKLLGAKLFVVISLLVHSYQCELYSDFMIVELEHYIEVLFDFELQFKISALPS